MASKMKYQVGKTLDNRIKDYIVGDFEQEIREVAAGYITGFVNGNSINYVGLTQSLKNDSALVLENVSGLQLMGLAYFIEKPSEQEIKQDLATLVDSIKSLINRDKLEILSDTLDCITNSLLVYFPDKTATTGVSRTIWTKDGPHEKPPKISVLESNKIYAHSAFAKLNIPFKLNQASFNDSIDHINVVKQYIVKDSDRYVISLKDSNYSLNCSDVKTVSETLYDHLIPPDSVTSIDDILSQTSSNKKEKELALKKVCDKWRNKQKERRAPLEFEVGQDKFGDEGGLRLNMELYCYIQMTDSLAITFRKILSVIYDNFSLLARTLVMNTNVALKDPNELRFCSFKPDLLDHLIYEIYLIENGHPNYHKLNESRLKLHEITLAPNDKPLFRFSQRITNLHMKNDDELKGYPCNVHADIATKSGINAGLRNIIHGTYTYHHYMQNNINDSGWGCAYRSLQTIISWFKHQGYIYSDDVKPYSASKCDQMDALRVKLSIEKRVPNHEEIQRVLVDIGDKNNDFIGSKRWIGSQEVCFVLDHLYGISSKFIAVSSASDLVGKARELCAHFKEQSTPVMIGGGVLAHTIIGIDFNEKNGDTSYLILDPHYTDEENLDKILKKGWCGWKKNSFWDKSAFYNLCLPQRPKEI